MRAIRMPVDVEFIERAMRFPPDMHIVGFVKEGSAIDRFIDTRQHMTVLLVVEHPKFEDHGALADMPLAAPTITVQPEVFTWKLGDVVLGVGRPK